MPCDPFFINAVHPPDPLHLIGILQCLSHTFLCCHLPREQFHSGWLSSHLRKVHIFDSVSPFSLWFYQIHTAPATGKRKIRRFLSEIFDRRRRIRFWYWKPEVSSAIIKRDPILFWQAVQVWPHFCVLQSGKQCKCHDTLKKVHSLASCLPQKLVEAPPQTPIRISDFIWKLRDSANRFRETGGTFISEMLLSRSGQHGII